MTTLEKKLLNINSCIKKGAKRAARNSEQITLVAVSKHQPISKIKAAYQLGIRHFGENYVQELSQKHKQLQHLTDIKWHFIGKIQSNKTQFIASHVHFVHSLCSEKIAKRLNDQRPTSLSPLDVLIQLNLSKEPNKQGIQINQLPSLAKVIDLLPNLNFRGLMALPPISENTAEQPYYFNILKETLLKLQHSGYNLDTLSMGTSQDFESAIMAGATMVRLGTCLFGPRILKV